MLFSTGFSGSIDEATSITIHIDGKKAFPYECESPIHLLMSMIEETAGPVPVFTSNG